VTDRVDTLALGDAAATGIAPWPDARHPTRPRDIPRSNPPILGRVRVPERTRDVIAGLEFHFTEFLPQRGFVVAGVHPHDEVELVGDRVPLIGAPERIEFGAAVVVRRGAAGDFFAR